MFFSSQAADNQAIVNALDSSQAVISFTPDGRILSANANFLAVTGYSLADILGKHHGMFCARIYRESEAYHQFWRELAQGRFQSGEFKRFTRTGETLWLQASYNPIRDKSGAVTKIVKFASDITTAKLAAIDRKGKVDAIDRAQAVIEFTPTGDIITANENFLMVTGYRLSEIQGKHHRLFCEAGYTHSEDYRRFWADLKGGRFQAGEYKRIAKGGREVYIQANYNPVFDDTGLIIKVVKFAIDITDVVERRLRNDTLSKDIHRGLGSVIAQVGTVNSMANGASTASNDTGGIINSVAAASEELSQSVRDIAQSMTYARSGAEDVFRHAEKANHQAGQLNQSAAAMTNVVTLIQDIAGQINLLALNATIESARAGDAGKGFAVVASEVKNLANQAANSTKTIAGEIATMQAVSTDVVDALNLISTSMTGVLDNVVAVASAIEQQSSVTTEITHNMQAAVTSVGQIQDSLGRITSSFGTVAQASEKVKQDVENMVA